MIVVLILLFGLISVILIIAIAWTHKPVSIWEMIKEELQSAAERKKK